MPAPFVGKKSLNMHAFGDEIARRKVEQTALMMARSQDARAIAAAKHDPTDPVAQHGKILRATDFVRRLQTINPNVVMLPKNAHQAYYGLLKDGKFYRVTGAGFPELPEWSILQHFEEEAPLVSPDKILTKDGIEIEHFTKDTPTMQTVRTSALEVVRGWRTILGLYIVNGHASTVLVEKEFGRPDRPSWAALLGHLKSLQGLTF